MGESSEGVVGLPENIESTQIAPEHTAHNAVVDELPVEQVSEDSSKSWAVRLFNKSPLKQKKYEMLVRFLGETTNLTCLDVGSDNGVISLLLRERGGTWHSCDLIPETVESIRGLVEERVSQVDGISMPYETAQFDVVAIVDLLEHIDTDREFVNELYRILKPGGTLIVNVPNPKRGLLRKIRHSIGQTDEAHGHVRPGYTLDELKKLLGSSFEVLEHESYSKTFSVFIDTFITFGLHVMRKGNSKKGTVVTGNDLGRMQKSFKLFSLLYPLIQLFVKLDEFFPGMHGNMLILKCRRLEPGQLNAGDEKAAFQMEDLPLE